MIEENVIPYEQLAPLLRPGMTGRELAVAILAKLGLSPKRYTLLTIVKSLEFHEDLGQWLREGLQISPIDDEEVRQSFDARSLQIGAWLLAST